MTRLWLLLLVLLAPPAWSFADGERPSEDAGAEGEAVRLESLPVRSRYAPPDPCGDEGCEEVERLSADQLKRLKDLESQAPGRVFRLVDPDRVRMRGKRPRSRL